MKFIPGPLGTNLSGKMGATVASHNRGGAYFRRRSKPTVSSSVYAEAAKAQFAQISAAWSDLGDSARAAWTLWAANNPVTDRIGQKVTLDGHSAYVKCNGNQEWAGGAEIGLPPVNPVPVALDSVSLDGAVVSGALNVTYAWTPSAVSQILMIRGCIMGSPGRSYTKGRMKLMAAGPVASGSVIDIMSRAQARLGTLQNGNRLALAVGIYDPVTGLQSMSSETSDTISGIA